MPQKLYKVSEAARILGRDKSQVYRYIREGRLQAGNFPLMPSLGMRISQESLDEFIKTKRKVTVTYGR